MSAAEDRARFTALAAHCGPRVIAYLARRTDPVTDAADIYQEVLITTWRRLDRVPAPEDQALAWMFAVARKALANHRRGTLRRLAATEALAQAVHGQARGATASGASLSGASLSAAGAGGTNDDARGMDAALGALSAEDRELIALVYWDGLSTEQAGIALGLSAVAARKRLSRARARLRAALARSATQLQPC